MKKLMFTQAIIALLFLSSCAFTNLFTKNLLDQKRRSFTGLTKMIFSEEGQMLGMSTASGSVIGHNNGKTYVLTARHFCEATGPKYVDIINVHTRKMDQSTATVLSMAPDIDACILETERLNVRPLLLAPSAPEIGEKIYNMAAPQGLFGEDLVMLYEGFYSGKLLENGQSTSDIYSLPANPGSSGSPVINSRGKLIGVVWAIHSRFHHITLSTPFEKLKEFINLNLPQD